MNYLEKKIEKFWKFLVHGIGAKLELNWEENMSYTKS